MQVLEQIGNNKIQIYTFPDCDSDEDEEFIQEDKELKVSKSCDNHVTAVFKIKISHRFI